MLLTIGAAGKMILPEISVSRIVMVAEVMGPNLAVVGSSGPSCIRKSSCHSTALLYRISTANSCSLSPVNAGTSNISH